MPVRMPVRAREHPSGIMCRASLRPLPESTRLHWCERSRGPAPDTRRPEHGKGAPGGAPRRPIWRPTWRPIWRPTWRGPEDPSEEDPGAGSERGTGRGDRTRNRTHATLPDEKRSAYGREMRRPWTTRCLRPGLRARLTLSDVRPDDRLDAGPVGPMVAGGRRCRLGPGYAPPKGPHRAPTHPSPTDRRRAAVRAAPRERDRRPGSRCTASPGASLAHDTASRGDPRRDGRRRAR